jgi:hypothetical protein
MSGSDRGSVRLGKFFRKPDICPGHDEVMRMGEEVRVKSNGDVLCDEVSTILDVARESGMSPDFVLSAMMLNQVKRMNDLLENLPKSMWRERRKEKERNKSGLFSDIDPYRKMKD